MTPARSSSISTTVRYEWDGKTARLVGYSECCKCERPTEDYVLCPNCGSVKR
ncbi:MAG TPA: hypothetical protein VK595_07650 [Vicinamibacterales bacterium]|nr:hypothetical protein [Vicinamibacterales bacterium]